AIARIYAAQIAGSADFAGDITALPPTILAGENASAPHLMWSGRRFGADETIALELAGACRHYTAGLARTVQLGRPGPKVLESGNVLHAILGMWMDGWGIEVSETILVAGRGCETLTEFPREVAMK